MRAYMQTCQHMCNASMYAYMLAYIHICEHICIYASVCAYMLVYMHKCYHICRYGSVYEYMPAYMHICQQISGWPRVVSCRVALSFLSLFPCRVVSCHLSFSCRRFRLVSCHALLFVSFRVIFSCRVVSVQRGASFICKTQKLLNSTSLSAQKKRF